MHMRIGFCDMHIQPISCECICACAIPASPCSVGVDTGGRAAQEVRTSSSITEPHPVPGKDVRRTSLTGDGPKGSRVCVCVCACVCVCVCVYVCVFSTSPGCVYIQYTVLF